MYDFIIRQVKILDGSKESAFVADLGVKGDEIAAIGDLKDEKAKQVFNGQGLALAPGFIDIHTHSDTALLADYRGQSHIQQGVTTEVLGQCGGSIVPRNEKMAEQAKAMQMRMAPHSEPFMGLTTEEYLAELDQRGVSLNAVFITGQGNARQMVMDYTDGPANPEQLEEMKAIIRRSMEEGSFGFSTGLIYTPSVYAEIDEIVELARVVAEYDGLYFTHIRGENDTVIQAVEEALEIGRRAKIAVQISHLKAMGRHMWGSSKEILKLIEQAREEGVDVTFDQYPYLAAACGLDAILPPWASVGGKAEMVKRLQDPELKAKMLENILAEEGTGEWISIYKGVGWDNIMITGFAPDHSLEGKMIAEIAEEKGQDPWDTCSELIIANQGNRVSIVYFAMGEEDLERIMVHPLQMVGSDTGAVSGLPAPGKPHPRAFGSFASILGKFVREKKLFSLEEAIYKMSTAAANRLGLKDRGMLKVGYKADLVLFNPDTVEGPADYIDPRQYAKGIEGVWVNGVLSVWRGEHTGARAGRVLKPSR